MDEKSTALAQQTAREEDLQAVLSLGACSL